MSTLKSNESNILHSEYIIEKFDRVLNVVEVQCVRTVWMICSVVDDLKANNGFIFQSGRDRYMNMLCIISVL